jgi:hypothetical protein
MIGKLAANQNWAKAAPALAVVSAALLFVFFSPSQPLFWALVNLPLYFLHQTEEHLWPGGFKKYMNRVVRGLPEGREALTDIQVFWINIALVWIAFAAFAALAFVDIGFGLLIIVFSAINCLTHIFEALRRRRWNPGLVMASVQLVVSIYAAYFITANGLVNPVAWWAGAVVFSAAVHTAIFRTALKAV